MSELQEYTAITDEEIPAAMAQVVADPLFESVAAYLYPEMSLDKVKAMLLGIRSVRDLQCNLMRRNLDRLLERSQTTFDYSLTPLLRHDQRYLFISNHRDIILDAMLLQCAFIDEHFETSRIIYGTNLLSVPMFGVISRANKMVGIARGGTPREFYKCLSSMSQFIREAIESDTDSVWIAQGNGRTKDGNDITDPAIIKMFAMSDRKLLSQAVADLHPVPISISYELEPCDAQKVIELTKRRIFKHYEKGDDEDFESVLTGITSNKRHVHITVCDPLTDAELLACHDDASAVAALIDSKIYSGYKLYPYNYVAYDLRYGGGRFAAHYTDDAMLSFIDHQQQVMAQVMKNADIANEEGRAIAEQIFLDIYANPVKNIEKL
ncbi:MAG: 1-acyl-sn-glycerol-3-phosphate acyltransferase [Bacteroidales bacterium]|nr:1-acyl-sn-glycerol-3-phosphate acyltransferase [Bacteroidales bacterium]